MQSSCPFMHTSLPTSAHPCARCIASWKRTRGCNTTCGFNQHERAQALARAHQACLLRCKVQLLPGVLEGFEPPLRSYRCRRCIQGRQQGGRPGGCHELAEHGIAVQPCRGPGGQSICQGRRLLSPSAWPGLQQEPGHSTAPGSLLAPAARACSQQSPGHSTARVLRQGLCLHLRYAPRPAEGGFTGRCCRSTGPDGSHKVQASGASKWFTQGAGKWCKQVVHTRCRQVVCRQAASCKRYPQQGISTERTPASHVAHGPTCRVAGLARVREGGSQHSCEHTRVHLRVDPPALSSACFLSTKQTQTPVGPATSRRLGPPSTPPPIGSPSTPPPIGSPTTSPPIGSPSTPPHIGSPSTPSPLGSTSIPPHFGSTSTPPPTDQTTLRSACLTATSTQLAAGSAAIGSTWIQPAIGTPCTRPHLPCIQRTRGSAALGAQLPASPAAHFTQRSLGCTAARPPVSPLSCSTSCTSSTYRLLLSKGIGSGAADSFLNDASDSPKPSSASKSRIGQLL